MPTSFDIEGSPAKAGIRSIGWELNASHFCPSGSYNGVTDHFSFDLYVPGSVNQGSGPDAFTTGDARLNFDTTFNVMRVASTVTLKPGRYAGSFSLTRSTEVPASDPEDPGSWDSCFVSVVMQPIIGPDDYEFQEPGDGLGRRPWPCFQNLNGDPTASDPFGLPTWLRTWTNYSAPDFNIATWPDSSGYEWVSGQWNHPSPITRYRCPFRIWLERFGTSQSDMTFHLDGHLLLS